MMKHFTLLLLTIALISSGSLFSQDKRKIVVIEDGTPSNRINLVDSKSYQNPIFVDNSPIAGTVPFINSYVDYVTNGNSLHQLLVHGDTVIVGIGRVDSLEAGTAATGVSARIYYNISVDGGTTWADVDGFVLSVDRKTRFPDLSLVHGASGYTIMSTGRGYLTPLSSSVRKPGAFIDIQLLGGSPSTFLVETATGYDFFSSKRFDGKVGGLFNSTDTLYYLTFDPATNLFSSLTYLFNLPPPSSNFVSSYVSGSSPISNQQSVAYCYVNEAGPTSLRVQTSADNGATWSTPTAVLQNNFINGDSVSPYWHEDLEYKPGTNDAYAVFSTRDIFASYTAGVDITRANKIILYSPALNGGNPVVVADRHNIPVLMDTNEFKKIVKLQVNSEKLSHPSIGFSTDGSVMYCTYSVAQTDTNNIGAVVGFNYFDIWLQKSTDGGLTWSTPKNITNTPLVDEMYPVVAPTGNGNNDAYVTYMSNLIPGSQTFADLQTTVITPQILNHVIGVGISNVSSTVPSSFSLQQNFPNPFNPSTTIRFDISKSTNITLKVYNSLGKEVATLANNERAEVGTNEIKFDASTLSTGVYFYTLTSGDFKETKKMMLIK